MAILAAIGAFFKKIWDWIKQTAWIQPLLIVGLIFGVIFSIKPIVDAVKASNKAKTQASAFYHNYQKSLAGGSSSDADKFTYDLTKVMNGEEAPDFKDKNGKRIYKFFVCYVAENCDICDAAKGGFDVLQDKMGSDIFQPKDDLPFNMFTIFADEQTEETKEDKTAFVSYLERHQSFFEECAAVAEETAYRNRKPLSPTDIEYLATSDEENFLTPTIFLVELDRPGVAPEDQKHGYDGHFEPGVTEVMFGVEGDSSYDKAKTLLDCWNHTGKFTYSED